MNCTMLPTRSINVVLPPALHAHLVIHRGSNVKYPYQRKRAHLKIAPGSRTGFVGILRNAALRGGI